MLNAERIPGAVPHVDQIGKLPECCFINVSLLSLSFIPHPSGH